MDRFLRLTVLALTGLGWLGSRALPWNVEARLAPVVSTQPDAPRLVELFCSGCHSDGRAKIDLNGQLDLRRVRRERPTWEKVLAKLGAAKMPPPRHPQPTSAERQRLMRWVEQGLAEESLARHGRIVARRLGKNEYANTIRDLVGVAFKSAVDFPADDIGWDRSLDMPAPPADVSKQYHDAAETIIAKADVTRLPGLAPPLGEQPAVEPVSFEGVAAYLDAERARTILAAFARRAYRRPLEAAELDSLASVFDDADKRGLAVEDALRKALRAVLVSPHFLYIIDKEPDPKEGPEKADLARQQALATRLSYFLWSSMPDDELLGLAERRALREGLKQQVARMLEDPRSRAFAADFAAYWLELSRFSGVPAGIDDALERAMRREAELFVDFVMRSNRSVLDFLDGKYTFVNQHLARHYGIPGIQGDQMQRVSLHGTPRAGLLTQAAVLTLTSPGARTSVTKRGKWVLDNLLGEPPAAPPAGLLEAFGQQVKSGTGTLRQLVELHRANPSCAHCHAKIDAIGISLENFGPTGAWRTSADNRLIEASEVMPTGELLDGPLGLSMYLRGKQEMFIRCLGGKLLSYALGRKLEARDWAVVNASAKRMADQDVRFSSLLLEVFMSDPFQNGWCQVRDLTHAD